MSNATLSTETSVDTRKLFSDPSGQLTLVVSFDTAVWIANSLPSNDEVTKALKRVIRNEYDTALVLDP